MTMNKRGWVAKDLILAIAIGSAVIGLFALSGADMATTYGNTNIINNTYAAQFNQLQNISNGFGQQAWNASNSGNSLNTVGTFTIMLQVTLSVVKLILTFMSPTGIISSTLASFASSFGIPSAVTAIVYTLVLLGVSISIIFIIINATKYGASKL